MEHREARQVAQRWLAAVRAERGAEIPSAIMAPALEALVPDDSTACPVRDGAGAALIAAVTPGRALLLVGLAPGDNSVSCQAIGIDPTETRLTVVHELRKGFGAVRTWTFTIADEQLTFQTGVRDDGEEQLEERFAVELARSIGWQLPNVNTH